jgi:hypothetical protein
MQISESLDNAGEQPDDHLAAPTLEVVPEPSLCCASIFSFDLMAAIFSKNA